MNCKSCTPTKPIALCTGELVIGLIPDDIENAIVVFTRREDGRQVFISGDISEDGTLSVDLTRLTAFWSDNLTYTIEVYEGATAADLSEPIEVEVGLVDHECFTLRFMAMYDENGVIVGSEIAELITS
jgi:hypothetical protein